MKWQQFVCQERASQNVIRGIAGMWLLPKWVIVYINLEGDGEGTWQTCHITASIIRVIQKYYSLRNISLLSFRSFISSPFLQWQFPVCSRNRAVSFLSQLAASGVWNVTKTEWNIGNDTIRWRPFFRKTHFDRLQRHITFWLIKLSCAMYGNY